MKKRNGKTQVCDVCGKPGARIRQVTETHGKGKDLLVIQNVPMVDRRGGHGRSAATFQPRVSQAMRSASRILRARANCARDTRTAKAP